MTSVDHKTWGSIVCHPIKPFFCADSEILILGSFPSVQSRKECFYYAHPRNRFWRVLSALYGEAKPETIADKQNFLARHRIALYDVIMTCRIFASGDQSIRDAIPTDLSEILKSSRISRICCNGKTAGKLYDAYHYPKTQIKAIHLPSTSPANAAWSEERLIFAWRAILEESKNLS